MTYLKKLVATAALAMAAILTAPFASSAQSLPPATELFAKYVDAVGGKDAILKITSMQTSATMEIPSMGLTATMEVWSAAPNKMASKTSIPGLGEMASGTNGAAAWEVSPMAAPHLLTGKELEQMMDNADFYANLLYPTDRFARMETVGVVDFNGEKAYKVITERKTSKKQTVSYFSVANGLLIGNESTSESQMGSMPGVQSMSAYKQFGSLKMPTKVEATMGPNKMLLTMTNVQFNAVTESAFEPPAQVKPLIKP